MTNDGRNPKDEIRRQLEEVLSSFGPPALAFTILSLCFLIPLPSAAVDAGASDYSSVDAIFSARCLDCHAGKDPEGQLVLDNFESLMKGGETGPAVVPGKSSDSLLAQMIEGQFEKNGKKKIM